MEVIYIILALVWSVLCLILFFKVWGMTNDVSEIKELLLQQPSLTVINETKEQCVKETAPIVNNEEETDPSTLTPGMKVIHKTLNKVLIIDSINNNGEAALCKDENGKVVATYHLKNLKKA